MKKTIKLLSFLFILTFAMTSCGDGNKECKEECKKECCEGKDKKACEEDCKKECCEGKDKKACEADCKKECCADKAGAKDSLSSDSSATTEVMGDEQAHTCTKACQDDPHSCPNHKH